MSSTVPYLKGTRTKYLNTLKNEIKYGLEILECDRESIDKEDFIEKTNKSIDKLKGYVDKLEIQTDKLAEKIDETESKFIQECVEENEHVLSQAIGCCSDLQHFKESEYLEKALRKR